MSCSRCNSTRKWEERENIRNNTGPLNNRKGIGNLSKISASIVANEQWSILITLEMPSFGLSFLEHCLLELFQRTRTTSSLFTHFDMKSKAQPLCGYKAVHIFKPKWPVTIRDYFLHASLEYSDVSCTLKKNNAFCNELIFLSLDILPVLPTNVLCKVIWFSYNGWKGS